MKNYNTDYIAFLPIGISFMLLGMSGDNKTPFLAVGIVFFILSLSLGFATDKDNLESKDEPKNPENNHTKE